MYFYQNSHLYRTRFFNVNYIKPASKLNKYKFRISVRGSYLWSEFLTQTEKEIESTSSFKRLVKRKLLSSYNELSHFWKSWKFVLINQKLPFLICDFYMIWCVGFDDKTSMVFCESHPYSNIKTITVIFCRQLLELLFYFIIIIIINIL